MLLNTKTALPLLLTCLSLTACGGGSGAPEAAQGPISEERVTAFKSMMPEFSGMGKMVKGDETYNVEKFQTYAATFAQSARKPFDHFADDKQGNGDALPVIWQKQAQFNTERDNFFAAVDALNAQAKNGKLENIKAAYDKVGTSCKSCHDSFRRPK